MRCLKYVTYIIVFCNSWTSQTKQINLAKKKQKKLECQEISRMLLRP